MTTPAIHPRPLHCASCGTRIPPAHLHCGPCWVKYWARVDASTPPKQKEAQPMNNPTTNTAAQPVNYRMRGGLVEAFSSSAGHGHTSMTTAVGALERVIDEGTWREFVTRDGRTVTPASFEEFLTTPPLCGAGTTVDFVTRMVRGFGDDMLEAKLNAALSDR